jgi:hypothetical protein
VAFGGRAWRIGSVVEDVCDCFGGGPGGGVDCGEGRGTTAMRCFVGYCRGGG